MAAQRPAPGAAGWGKAKTAGRSCLFALLGTVAFKGLYLLSFYALFWFGRQLALAEVDHAFLAVFAPFALLGGLAGLLRSKGGGRSVAVLRGARDGMLIVFFSVSVSMLALACDLRVGQGVKPAVAQIPTLALAGVALLHAAMKAAAAWLRPRSRLGSRS